MIFNAATSAAADATHQINALVGQPFGYVERILLGKTKSVRMVVAELSPSLENFEKQEAELDYGLIELREKGVLVFLGGEQPHFIWAIPYYQLYLYFSTHLTIHGQGHFVKFEQGHALNQKFTQQIMDRVVKASSNRIDDL